MKFILQLVLGVGVTISPLHHVLAMSSEDILFNFSGVVGLVDTQRDKWNKNIRSMAQVTPVIVQGDDATGVQMAVRHDMGYEITNPVFSSPSQPDFLKYTVVFSPPHNTPENRAMLEKLAPQIVGDYASQYKLSSEVVDLHDDHGLAMVIITCMKDAPRCPF